MGLTWESPHVMQLLRPHKRENISSMLGLKKGIKCFGEKKIDYFMHHSLFHNQTNLHPAARVQERAPSSSSGGSSPSSYWAHNIIVINKTSLISFGVLAQAQEDLEWWEKILWRNVRRNLAKDQFAIPGAAHTAQHPNMRCLECSKWIALCSDIPSG